MAALSALLALCAPAAAADGDLDVSFAGDGVSHLERGRLAEVALQPDGKLIVAGASFGQDGEAVVGRLTASGSPDPTFGEGGYASLGAVAGEISVRDVALQPDGRIVVVGYRGQEAYALRLTDGGDLDPTFDGDGFTAFRFDGAAPTWSGGQAVAVQGDGRIVVAGSHDTGTESAAGVARLDPDGSFDETFAGDGTTLVDVGDAEIAFHLAIQGGRIVVAGHSGPPVFPYFEFWAARLEAGGTLDETFGTEGVFTTNTLMSEDGIVTAGGGLLFTGTGLSAGEARDAALLKLDADGHPDEAFAPGGLWTHDVAPGGSERGMAVAENHAGDFTLAVEGGGRLAAVKVSPAGALVTSFGDGGTRLYDSIGPFAARDAVRQPDGKLVVGGDDGEGMAAVRIHDTAPPTPPAPPAPPAPPDAPGQPPTPRPPLLELLGGSAAEGGPLVFTATLSRPSDVPVSFSY
ncbi:MAG TPA: hypothetical protein VF715_15285, partial [Thermoleophilaceae bacterium]